MKIYLKDRTPCFTSDTHYGHANILKYSDRPFLVGKDVDTWESILMMGARARTPIQIEEHKDAYRKFRPSEASVQHMICSMILNHNSIVKEGDIVFLQGDVAFDDIDEIIYILEQLNGEKHLILGNHDKMIIKNPRKFIGQKLFRTIEHYREITVIHPQAEPVNGKQNPEYRQKIILFHYPIASWNHAHHGAWHLHGHCHGSFRANSTYVDVGVDAPFITGKPEYRPFTYHEIQAYMAKQKFRAVDHHDGGD